MTDYLERKFQKLASLDGLQIVTYLKYVNLFELRDYCMRTFPDSVYYAFCCPTQIRLKIAMQPGVLKQLFAIEPVDSDPPSKNCELHIVFISPAGNMQLELENTPSLDAMHTVFRELYEMSARLSKIILNRNWDHLSVRNVCKILFPEHVYIVRRSNHDPKQFALCVIPSELVSHKLPPGTFILYPDADSRHICIYADDSIEMA